MILHNEYLTDEELMMLISEAEDELVTAPPELTYEITKKIFGPEQRNVLQKKTEFTAYCLRVALSVAAAVAFVFILPYLPGIDCEDCENETAVCADKESFLKENDSYPTKEEVLNDKSIIRMVLEGENIFDNKENNNKIKYEDENGGW